MRPEVKFRVIYRHKDKYSISEMCRFFDVSRSGYYGFFEVIRHDMTKQEAEVHIAQLQAFFANGWDKLLNP